MNELAPAAQAAMVIANVDRITASWPDLLTSPIRDEAEYEQIRANVIALSDPAPREWTMARVASLLMSYYAADVGEAMVSMMAEDWAEALKDHPQWAITKAVRWWKSSDNPKRNIRPVEGDIQRRCEIEEGILKVGKLACRRFRNGVLPIKPDEHRKPIDAKRAAQIMAEVGFKPKRFGGAA